MKSPSPVSHVSDTARWVAIYRAMESERPDAIFRDPYARRLGGAEGERIVREMPRGRQNAWPMIVRTAVMDEIIIRLVSREGVDCVLNLAAGLDARPYRLPLQHSMRWVDVDLPDILSHKEETLAGERPQCALEFVKVDLADGDARRAVFRRIGGSARNVLVISEGLLVYLTPEHVAELARDLHAEPSFRWWLIDLASPRLLKMLAKSWGRQLAKGNAPMIFGPAEGTAFFQPHGWDEAEFRPTFQEALRLKRTFPLAWLWNLIGKLFSKKKQEEFRRMSGSVLLKNRNHQKR